MAQFTGRSGVIRRGTGIETGRCLILRTVLRFRIAAVVAALALVGPLLGAAWPPHASAQFWPAGIDVWVDSSMGPVKSRVFRAKDGNTRKVAYALDGLRATIDISGWERETTIAQFLTGHNINVVMPVGGRASFYSNWLAPSDTNDQQLRYTWETFLTRDLPAALRARLGFQPFRNAVFGLSMSGSSALVLAAYHPNQFSYAASLSGVLNPTAPGMPQAIGLAQMDAGGYNVNDMWGPPGGPLWARNDPTLIAPLLKAENMPLFISCGSGVPAPSDLSTSSSWAAVAPQLAVIEGLVRIQNRAFQQRLAAIGYANVTYNFPPDGIHWWNHWSNDVRRMTPAMSAHIG